MTEHFAVYRLPPRPWTVTEHANLGTTVIDRDGGIVSYARATLGPTEQRSINQLHAAAPDLYLALQAFLVPAGDTEAELQQQARAAIARAEGREP